MGESIRKKRNSSENEKLNEGEVKGNISNINSIE